LAIRLREQWRNLEAGHLERSRIAQRDFEEKYFILYKLAKTLQIEKYCVYGKYKEAAHISCLKDPISQPSIEILPNWLPLVSEK
jgi:hypothetical protein